MCGISGIVQLQGSSNQLPAILKNMNDKLKHRGPDDEGFTLFKDGKAQCFSGQDTPPSSLSSNLAFAPKFHIDSAKEHPVQVGFGHRRLAIIDLSAGGHQPMCLQKNPRIWITLNGEIYNYIELREELRSFGYTFHTESDVEVVLVAYLHWGTNCLAHFNGMWSFVLYDIEKNLLFGSRDRFGVKPLYYLKNEQHFAFASEQKALLEVPSYLPAVNVDALLPFLLYGHVELQSEGFFKDLYELRPGHFFTFDLSKSQLEIQAYFELNVTQTNPAFRKRSFEQATLKTKELIKQAVRIRFRSDVPIGFCLSGGLDSSTIVCTAAQIVKEESISSLKHGVKTFTASNDSPLDESSWAKQIIDHTNAEWHNITIDSSTLVEDIQKLIYFQDIPLATTSTYAQSRVMRAAHEQGISILIDGQGGDELYAGYQTFYYSYFNQLFTSFQWKTLFKEGRSLKNSPVRLTELGAAFIKIKLSKTSVRFREIVSKKWKSETKLITPTFLHAKATQLQFQGEFRSESMNQRLKRYCTETYLKSLLRWEDRCSMQYSIESRTPFSDDINLIQHAFSLPANYKIKNGWSKYILRESIKGLVPESIRLRKDKKGFSIPQNKWLMEQESAFFDLFQSLKHLDVHELVQKELIESNWKVFFSDLKHIKEQDLIFRYVCYLSWLKQFIYPERAVSLA
jgi:asparagine synthase (glutamine-hydrolysing)